jgi:hypothetical protein
MPVPTADVAIASIRSDIADIRAALVRLGKLPADEPRKKKRSGKVWVNFYAINSCQFFYSRADADEQADTLPGRIACVPVEWTEGDGLDEAEAP